MPAGRHVPCPSCGSSDAGFEYADGHFHCHKCGSHGGDKPKPNMTGLLTVTPCELPKRGLTAATCAKWGYGISTLSGKPCQVATYYRDGEPVAQKVRFQSKAFTIVGNAKAMPLYGEHLWRDKGKMVVVTEGEIDALSVSQVQDNKWPVVSVPNGAQNAAKAVAAALEWLLGFEVVVFMFDMDEPGRKAARECAELLPPGRAKIASLPLKDANEMLVAGRVKELVDAIWGAKEFHPDGILSADEMWNILTDDSQLPFVAYPFDALQARTGGCRFGEIVVLVAGTTVGKSTFVRQVAVSFMEQGVKVGYIGLEENARRSLQGFCSVVVGKPLHLNPTAVDRTALRAAFDRLKPRLEVYDHQGRSDSEGILRKMRYMATGLGCRVVFLDHLSLVAAGFELSEDERRSLDHLMKGLVTFVQETGVTVFTVCHLSRPDKKGKTHEEGRQVTLADIRGSHGIAQAAFDVIALERNTQSDGADRNQARVRVLKCRHTGDTGKAGIVAYDNNTGLLTEVGGAEFEEVSDATAPAAY